MTIGNTMAFEPDYSKYSTSDLYDALDNINGKEFPERLKKIKHELELRVGEDEQEYNPTIKEMSPSKKNVLGFFLFFSIMLAILYAEYVPMRGFVWITKQTQPELYWICFVIFGLFSFYYAKKYLNDKKS